MSADRRGAVRRRRLGRRLPVGTVVSLGVLAVVIVAAVLAPVLSPYSPLALDLSVKLQGPSWSHWMGTDNLGRDVLSRLLYGLRPSLLASGLAVLFGACGGVILGLPAGYLRGFVDVALTRLFDLMISWPSIFVAIALVLVFGTGEAQIILAIGLAELPVFARIVRAIALVQRESEHVVAVRASGGSQLRIMFRHVLPFTIAPVIVQLAISAPQALMAEAGLNYLGLGTQPPSPSLGAMVSTAQGYLSQSISALIFPIAVIVMIVLALTTFADTVQDILNPRRGHR